MANADIYLKLEGVKAESSDAAHKDEMEIVSFSFGVSQAVTQSASGDGTFTVGRCQMSPVTVGKALDASSPILAQACASGKHFPSATLTLNRAMTADGTKAPYMVYTLTDVLIESISTGGSGGGDLPHETMSLVYGQINWDYMLTKTTGDTPSHVLGGWSLKENKAV